METIISVTIESPIDAEVEIGHLTQFGQVSAVRTGDNKVKIYNPFITAQHPANDSFTVTSEVHDIGRAQMDVPNVDGQNP